MKSSDFLDGPVLPAPPWLVSSAKSDKRGFCFVCAGVILENVLVSHASKLYKKGNSLKMQQAFYYYY